MDEFDLDYTKIGLDDLEQIKGYIEVPKDGANGDYAFPCFKLAKDLKKSPIAIANKITKRIVFTYNKNALFYNNYIIYFCFIKIFIDYIF